MLKNWRRWSTFGRWDRQNVHQTVAGARFAFQNRTVRQLRGSEHFGKMKLAKCARDCSESSICISMKLLCTPKSQKNEGIGAFLEDQVSQMCTRDCSESTARARFPFQNVIKKQWRRSTFGRWGRPSAFVQFVPLFVRSFLPSFIPSFIHSFIYSFMNSFPSLSSSFKQSFIQSFLPSFLPSFLHSFIPSFLPSLIRSFSHSFIHFQFITFHHGFLSLQASSHRFPAQKQFQQYKQNFSYSHFLFSKLPPRRVPGTTGIWAVHLPHPHSTSQLPPWFLAGIYLHLWEKEIQVDSSHPLKIVNQWSASPRLRPTARPQEPPWTPVPARGQDSKKWWMRHLPPGCSGWLAPHSVQRLSGPPSEHERLKYLQ